MDSTINQNLSSLSLFNNDPKNITFDNITGEHNYRKCSFLHFLSYISLLISIILQFSFLASDIFTLIQIYALKNWQDFHTITYIPILTYKIVFTTCIGLSFIYLIFTWLLGFIIQRKNKIINSYLHSGARQIDSLKNYQRFCIYEQISTNNFNDWFCLLIYNSYHYEIFNWLLADSPRQILNGATIAYSISNKFTTNDISSIISKIASTNHEEAILLSFMFFSFIIWLFFTFKNLIIIITSICIIPSIKNKFNKNFNNYCTDLVAQSVSDLYNKKVQIQEKEFEKRRKVPSFMNNFNELNNELDNNNDFNNDSLTSLSFDNKSNPFNIELSELPLSHSKSNLLNRSNSKLDSFSNNNDLIDPFNQSRINLINNYNYNSNSQNIPLNNNNNLNPHHSYIYVPSKVYEESYHQTDNNNNDDNKIFYQQQQNQNDDSYELFENNSDSINNSNNNNSNENVNNYNPLYESRGLVLEKREIL
jgi:hypothetical protein